MFKKMFLKLCFFSTFSTLLLFSTYGYTAPVPIKINLAGKFTFTSETSADMSGEGISSHIGNSVSNGHMAIVGSSQTCPNGIVIAANEAIASADGDLVFLTLSLVGCPNEQGIYAVDGTFQITGGTGKFAQATGGGTYEALANFGEASYVCLAKGTIDYNKP